MNRNSRNEVIEATLLTLLIGGLIVLAVLYRHQETIVVEARWWSSSISVKYDESYTVVVPHTVTSCSGDNCTTRTEFRTETRTTTHTRCTDGQSGTELPVIYPNAPCALHSGDYVIRGQEFRIAYHVEEDDKQRQALFSEQLWDVVEPGRTVTVKKNVQCARGQSSA